MTTPIRLTAQQILDRMRLGKRLRWVAASVLNKKRLGNPRSLYLGADVLDPDTCFTVIAMEKRKQILEVQRPDKGDILDYELGVID